MLISVADCNHGFWEPELEECKRLSDIKGVDIQFAYHNCSQSNLIESCQGSSVVAVQRLFLNKHIVSNIKSCRVVVRLGVGLENICLPDMKELGVRVINFPDFCTTEVANHALALILSSYRRLNVLKNYQTELSVDNWGKPDLMKTTRSADKTTIGILGYGRIGSQVAYRLSACGFKIIVCDPYVNDPVACCSLEELFSESDIVTIHCNLTPETSGMVNRDMMSLMKCDGAIVNTARGSVVNSADLKLMLASQRLRMAYVDVYEPEPADSAALNHANLYITPHIAFYSWDSLDWLKREFIRQSVEAVYEM